MVVPGVKTYVPTLRNWEPMFNGFPDLGTRESMVLPIVVSVGPYLRIFWISLEIVHKEQRN